MEFRVLHDKSIERRIEFECSVSPARSRIEMIFDAFSDYHVFEMGGSVRNAVISEWYGIPFSIRDLDFLIDDSKEDIDLFRICREYSFPGEIKSNFYGTVKWTIDDFDIDISKFSSGNKNEPSIENWLRGCDFNICGIVYSHDSGKIYSYGALEGIKEKNIVLIKPEYGRPEATMVRAVDFERKLSGIGFRLDQSIVDYVLSEYSDGVDDRIKKYMEYKKMPNELYPRIISRLKEIRETSSFD